MSYLLLSTLSLSIFYLAYHFLLRQDKVMKLQRAYLLGSVIISLIIPIIDLDLFSNSLASDIQAVITTNSSAGDPMVKSKAASFGWQDYLFITYILGASIMLLNSLRSLAQIISIIKSGEQEIRNGLKIIWTDKKIPISSFFSYVIIYKGEAFSNEELAIILTHEKKHIDDMHSLDIIMIECLKIIYWFNPVIYFINKSLKAVHEYLSDEETIKYHPKSAYENLLISALFRKAGIPLMSQFSEVSVKERINMLNQKPPSIMRKLKYLMIIPLTLALIWACDPQDANETVMPESAPSETVAGLITDADGQPLPGVNVVVEGTTIGTVTDINGMYKLKVPKNSSLVTSFIGFQTVTTAVDNNAVLNIELQNE